MAMRGKSVSGYIHICVRRPRNAAISRCDHLVDCRPIAASRGFLQDWYRTFAKLAGMAEADILDQRAAAAGLPPLDSLDVWALLSGANATSPRWRHGLQLQSLCGEPLLQL